MNLGKSELDAHSLIWQTRHTGPRYRAPAFAGTSIGTMINLGALPDASDRKPAFDRPLSGPQDDTMLVRLRRMLSENQDDASAPIRLPEPMAGLRVAPFDLAPAKVGGKRGAAKAGAAREELLASAAQLRFLVLVQEQKGGVGKSVTAMVANETLKMISGKRISLIDADVVNRNLSRAGLTKAGDALNAGRIDFEGFLFDAAERLICDEVDGFVVDSAAGGEGHFRPHLAELARTLRGSDAKTRLVIARPLTTSPLVHDNVMEFSKHFMTPDMGVLLVRNLGQGRTSEDFAEFDASPEYAAMRELGMAECLLESAGAKYSDMITGFNKSFADIALNEPDQLGLEGRQLEIARRVFTRPVRLFLARWLYRQTTSFQAGLIESVLSTL